tara:strand:+ start:1269 stop:1976 length:708 start_codon:yes stop_codon:yes gene_type:complete
MEQWFETLGFQEDPFNDSIINSELKEEIFYNIEAGNLLFIEGPEASGKTSLLKFAINTFKGNKKVAFIDCRNFKDINIESILKKRNTLLRKEGLPKNMILLLDDIQELSIKNAERLKFYHDHNYIKSAILTGKSFKETNLPKSLKERIGSRIISLQKLSEEKIAKILKHAVMPENVIKEVYSLSNKNIKELTENLAIFYKEVKDKPIEEIQSMNQEEIKQILDKNENVVQAPGVQ